MDRAQQSEASSLVSLIGRLRAPTLEEREEAAAELERLSLQGWSLAEARALLESATESFPARKYPIQDSAADLVRAVGTLPVPEWADLVVQHFGKYRPAAREAALEMLASIPGHRGLEAILSLGSAGATARRRGRSPSSHAPLGGCGRTHVADL